MEPSQPPAATPAPIAPLPPAPPAHPPRSWRRSALRALEAATVLATLGALGLWCSVPDTEPLATRNPASTAFIDLRREQAEDAGKPFKLRWQWRSIGSISRYLRAAVIYAEDYNFYHHNGIDWDAIEHAVQADWNKGAMAVGGSTITQQLAKNLYLSPSRSVVRKMREALIAFSLEDDLSKQRILEIYLNIVEWGDGIFGAEAASRAWFHHSAASLTPAEAVRLAIALPNPFNRAPNVRSAELTKKAVRLLRLLRMQGLIDSAEERVALDQVGAPGERVLPDREAAAPTALTREPPIVESAPTTRPDPAPDVDPTPAAPATPPPNGDEPSPSKPPEPAGDHESPPPPSEPPAPPASEPAEPGPVTAPE